MRWSLVVSASLLLVGCGDESGVGGAGGAVIGGQGQGGQGGTGGEGGTAPTPAPDPVGFSSTTSLAVPRTHHTATLLADGRVLIVGGDDAAGEMIDAVEIFDPSDASFTTLDPLPEPRSNHTATLLADGRVLIAGGGTSSAIGVPNGVIALDSAVVFDPADGSYTEASPMADRRADHRAFLLPDGRVLVAGGATDQVSEPCTVIPNCTVGIALASAELFDSSTMSFTPTGSMTGARYSTVAAALLDGRVLFASGVDGATSIRTAEIYDPASGEFGPAPDLAKDRLFAAGATLGSGKVVVAGGKKADVAPQASTEVYDPSTNTWNLASDLAERRTGAAAVTLQSGHVLHIGGFDQGAGTSVDKVEIFDEATGKWTEIGALEKAVSLPTATVLSDGQVLVCGGSSNVGPTKACEISTPGGS